MKKKLHAYKKTVSIVNETAISMYEGIGKGKKGFLLESYDKNNGRYSFFGIEPEEIITSKGNSLVIKHKDGSEDVREGNPLELLKEYYSSFEVTKDDGELAMRRGLYGGATGYLGFNGNMDFCITIRTMIKKGNKVYLQAGAGIVADSVGESEYQECCNKVMALAKTLVEEESL